MSDSDSSIPTAADQLAMVKAAEARSRLEPGQEWFVISSKWYNSWKTYVGWYTTARLDRHPGEVDTASLMAVDGTLRSHMIEDIDYHIVCPETWELFKEWYKVVGQPIPRKVIRLGRTQTSVVEVYPMTLRLVVAWDSEAPPKTFYISKVASLKELREKVAEMLDQPVDDLRIWNFYSGMRYSVLESVPTTVEDSRLVNQQLVLAEKRTDDGTDFGGPARTNLTTVTPSYTSAYSRPITSAYTAAPPPTYTSSSVYRSSTATTSPYSTYTNPLYSSRSYNHYYDPNKSYDKGVMGLSNLGNTCFMNSGLQCLSNSSILTRYILKGKYVPEINKDNPLGMKGEVATSYAELIKTLWSGKGSATSPTDFKYTIGRFAPRFDGYSQQDSQELVAFLLDGIHEDLNRCLVKPFTEQVEGAGRPDKEVADEAWAKHLLRNNSVIVDHFQGQLKSTVVCPDDGNTSIKFDPFMYLSLPLPVKTSMTVNLLFVPKDSMVRPKKYSVSVKMIAPALGVLRVLSPLVGVPAKDMIMTETYSSKFHKVFDDEDTVADIREEDDIVVYEVDPYNEETDMIVPVVHRNLVATTQAANSMYRYTSINYTYPTLLGFPFVITLPKTSTVADAQKAVMARMARYVNTSALFTDAEQDPSAPSTASGANGSDDEDVNRENAPSAAVLEGAPKDSLTTPAGDPLFKILIVNSTGRDVGYPAVDGRLNFSAILQLGCDWKMDVFKAVYDVDEAKSFEEDASFAKGGSVATETIATHIKLEECMKLFTTDETLSEGDEWYCSVCKTLKQASKKLEIWKAPDVLVIHLKRFSYTRYNRDKIDTLVDFPIEDFDITPYILNQDDGLGHVYDLFAVSNHFGGLGGGHYTAFCKNRLNGKWYDFDDSTVTSISEDSIISRAAYMLFYQRRGSVPDADDDLADNEESGPSTGTKEKTVASDDDDDGKKENNSDDSNDGDR